MSGTIESCPHCQMPFGGSFMGVSSRLGSRTYLCKSCGEPFLSGRWEWAEMRVAGKLWYCLASLAYAIVLGLFGGVVCLWVAQFLSEGPQATKNKPAPDGRLFFCGCVLVAVTVAALQYFRVVLSLRRTRSLKQIHLVASYWSFQTNLQFLCLMGLFSIAIVAWLISWLT